MGKGRCVDCFRAESCNHSSRAWSLVCRASPLEAEKGGVVIGASGVFSAPSATWRSKRGCLKRRRCLKVSLCFTLHARGTFTSTTSVPANMCGMRSGQQPSVEVDDRNISPSVMPSVTFVLPHGRGVLPPSHAKHVRGQLVVEVQRIRVSRVEQKQIKENRRREEQAVCGFLCVQCRLGKGGAEICVLCVYERVRGRSATSRGAAADRSCHCATRVSRCACARIVHLSQAGLGDKHT